MLKELMFGKVRRSDSKGSRALYCTINGVKLSQSQFLASRSYERFSSRGESDFANRVLSAMRITSVEYERAKNLKTPSRQCLAPRYPPELGDIEAMLDCGAPLPGRRAAGSLL